MNNNFIQLIQSKNTVFSYNDLAYFFGNDKQKLIAKVVYYTKKWYLYKIKRWLYALNKDYDVLEFATKIQKWSYIWLQTALKIYWINFQYDSRIYVIWYKNEEIKVDWNIIVFKVIKKEIRETFEWIECEKWYSISTKYRTILDTLYLYKNFHFDNLDEIEWSKIEELLKIYKSNILEKRIQTLKNNYLYNEYYS